MGIIYRQARMLLDAHRAGIAMDRLLMIGRQSLFLHSSELRAIREVSPRALADYQWGEYSDRFFKECLGAYEVNTLDYSPYEGANLLYDLNQPVPGEVKGRFDVVVEAGSLEHVFNFPIAIANLMQMTKVGGSIFASTVSNNLCGHGFYQFSPELIFRIFTAENGFELGKVLAIEARYPGIELTPISGAFEVADPASVGERVGVVTTRPIMLFFDARKTKELPLFARPPMQSDYAAAWDSNGNADLAVPTKSVSRTRQWIRNLAFYSSFRRWQAGQRQLRQYSLKNERMFRKI
jgi:hypothetical protein